MVSTLTVVSAVPDKHCYYLVEVGVKHTSMVSPLSGPSSHGPLPTHGMAGISHPVDTLVCSIGDLP